MSTLYWKLHLTTIISQVDTHQTTHYLHVDHMLTDMEAICKMPRVVPKGRCCQGFSAVPVKLCAMSQTAYSAKFPGYSLTGVPKNHQNSAAGLCNEHRMLRSENMVLHCQDHQLDEDKTPMSALLHRKWWYGGAVSSMVVTEVSSRPQGNCDRLKHENVIWSSGDRTQMVQCREPIAPNSKPNWFGNIKFGVGMESVCA